MLLTSRGQSVLIHLAVMPSFVHHLKILQAEVEQTKASKIRQKENNDIMLRLLLSGDITLVKHYCNIKELHRLLEDLDIDEERLINKCADDLLFAKVVARQISKMASRQRTKDETIILQKCHETTSTVCV